MRLGYNCLFSLASSSLRPLALRVGFILFRKAGQEIDPQSSKTRLSTDYNFYLTKPLTVVFGVCVYGHSHCFWARSSRLGRIRNLVPLLFSSPYRLGLLGGRFSFQGDRRVRSSHGRGRRTSFCCCSRMPLTYLDFGGLTGKLIPDSWFDVRDFSRWQFFPRWEFGEVPSCSGRCHTSWRHSRITSKYRGDHWDTLRAGETVRNTPDISFRRLITFQLISLGPREGGWFSMLLGFTC